MTDKPKPPWSVTEQLRDINISGYLLPWNRGDNGPVYCMIAGTPDIFVPVFSTSEKLDAYFDAAKIEYDSIKQIEEMHEFLSSFPYRMATGERIRVIIDPWVNERNNTRFTEILRVPGRNS